MNTFTNIDAMWLAQLAEGFSPAQPDEAAIHARLLRIASNVQGLDERNQMLSHTGDNTYAAGYAAAEARMRRRSNVLANPEGEDETGKSILDQINRRVAENNVKRYAVGERALEDKPHMFNGPMRRAPAKAKATPKIDLDLDFLNGI